MSSSIANLWADKIIQGDRNFKEVPTKLEDLVKESLTERGYTELIEE